VAVVVQKLVVLETVRVAALVVEVVVTVLIM
jgi:hypothetical protein